MRYFTILFSTSVRDYLYKPKHQRITQRTPPVRFDSPKCKVKLFEGLYVAGTKKIALGVFFCFFGFLRSTSNSKDMGLFPRVTAFCVGMVTTAPLYLLVSQNLKAETQRVASLVSITRLELSEGAAPQDEWGTPRDVAPAGDQKPPFFDDVKRSFRKNWNGFVMDIHDRVKNFVNSIYDF